MKKNLLIALCLMTGIPLFATSNSANSLLTKHFEAVNQPKLSTINSLFIQGSFVQGGTKLELTIHKQRPDQWRQEISTANQAAISVIDGDSGWEINPFNGTSTPRDYTQDEVKSLLTDANIDNNLWHYFQEGAEISSLGEENVAGRTAHKLEVSHSETGYKKFFWIDDATKQVVQKMDTKSGITHHYEGTQWVDGIMFPKSVRIKYPQTEVTFNYSSIELDKTFDKSLFEKPNIKSVKDVASEYLKAFYDLDYDRLKGYYTKSHSG